MRVNSPSVWIYFKAANKSSWQTNSSKKQQRLWQKSSEKFDIIQHIQKYCVEKHICFTQTVVEIRQPAAAG